MANLLDTIRHSGTRLGPLDAMFTGLDYADGKASGEDDIRAGAGAVGSTLGGWGGAIAGAGIGATLGSAIPVVGTAIGGAVGSIVGGMGGSFGGGWGADRTDELIRGKGNKQMELYDKQGRPVVQREDGSWGILDYGAATAGGYTAFKGLQGAVETFGDSSTIGNPANIYRQARRNPDVGMLGGLGAIGENYGNGIAKTIKNLPMGAKIAGAGALGYGLNKVLGNPVGRLVDTATGQATNFDNDEENRMKSDYMRQARNNADIQRQQSQMSGQLKYDELRNDGTLRYLDEEKRKDNAEAEAYNNRNFYRDTLESRRTSAYSARTDAARNLLDGYMRSIPDAVARSVQNVNSARF